MRILTLVLFLTGCAPYVQVQTQLVEQTRRGLTQLESSLEEKSQFVAAQHASQRRRLDEAFDADVRNREELSADWVIEHRRAYASAVDVLASARAASIEANEIDRRNLAAIRVALDRLHFLQSLQLRTLSLTPETENEQD